VRVGKILTVVFKIEEEAASDVLWQSKDRVAGCSIMALSWGHMWRELEFANSRYEAAKKLLERSSEYDAVDKLDRLKRMQNRKIER
jgi:hypothetical protein